jgi:hypothetical protein
MLDRTARLMRASACAYALAGFDVFPLQVGGKMPYKGSHGELDATHDPELVARVWTELPGSNIGWFLGPQTLAFVLDVDERNGGAEWLARRPALPHTVRVLTPSKGLGGHHWFLSSRLSEVKCTGLHDEWVNGFGDVLADDCVDIKGLHSGYVVLPPSRTKKGLYTFESGAEFGQVEIAEPPQWLEEEIRAQGAPTQARTDHVSFVDPNTFQLGRLFLDAGLLGQEIRPGVWHALCPNREHHSGKPRKWAGDVVLFAPPPGRNGPGYAHCAHAHCRDLTAILLGKA